MSDVFKVIVRPSISKKIIINESVPGTIWHRGAGVPSGTLGAIDDFYVNTTNNDYYQKTATSTWTLIGNFSTTGATINSISGPLLLSSGVLSLPKADASNDGYLDNLDFQAFSAKEPAISAGSISQYLRGDKSLSNFATDAKTAVVSDTAYNASSWDSVVDVAPSKNSVRDQIEAMLTSIAGKEPAITAGTSSQYFKGDKSLGTFATDVDARITAQKGQNNGLASLDGGGKVPVNQLPSSLMEYKGVWNASTNSPSLADGSGNTGDVYRVGTAGSQNLGSGSISFDVGDYVIFNGSTWEKSDTTDAVASVNGQTGNVSLTTSNISEGSNLYYLDSRAKAAAVSDTAYNATSWDAVVDVAPSKNAVRDQIETLITSIATKEPAITSGTTAKYWRGDKTFQTLDTSVVPENGNIYYTDSRAKAGVVSDTAYNATSWDAVVDIAPSKNAVRDQIETMLTSIAGKQVSGNYITALTGDGTASGPGSAAFTLANSAVTNSKMANMVNNTVKGNISGSTAAPSDLAVDTANTASAIARRDSNGLINAQIQSAINVQTGTTYTLNASDNGKLVTLNNASAITLTIPNTLPTGFSCDIAQLGAGQVTVVAGTGVTLGNADSQFKLAKQKAGASIVGYASNTYLLQGYTAA